MGNGDGIIHFRDGIAIAQLVIFSFSFYYALTFRWTRRIGWFTIGVFSILRLVGAGCMVGTITHDKKSLWSGVFVCENLGMILLIFTILEMMGRINKVTPTVHKYTFLVPQILTWIDIAISIGGYVTVARKTSDQLLPTDWSRATTAILGLIYIYTVGVFVYFFLARHTFARAETPLLSAVAFATPLLAVRVVYSIIFIATSELFWSPVKGNPTAYLLMTFLPELGFVAVCVATIMYLPPLKTRKEGMGYQRAEEEGEGVRLTKLNSGEQSGDGVVGRREQI